MEDTGQNGYSNPRLDRIEAMLNIVAADHVAFADEHKKLLVAQVVLTDRLEKLTDRVDKLAATVEQDRKDWIVRDEATDARLHALVVTVDEWIRGRPTV